MSVTGTTQFEEICARGSIHAGDVAVLRALYYKDGLIDAGEAEALLAIDHACRVKDTAWQTFIVEAITDYIVDHAEPSGYVTAANVDWLIEAITRDGSIETGTELEIVVRVLEKADWAPESLSKFALRAVRDAILMGQGRLFGGGELKAGDVTEGAVDLLRRIVFAFGGAGHAAVTRAEAEVLFEINDATAETPAHPAWTEFFAKAIAGTIMAASGYRAPQREVALAREQWLQSRGNLKPIDMVSAMYAGGVSGFSSLFKRQNEEDQEWERLERERHAMLTAEEVTGDEARWLADQINRDGKLTYNEACLLEFLRAESPKLHPLLQPLLDRAKEMALDAGNS